MQHSCIDEHCHLLDKRGLLGLNSRVYSQLPCSRSLLHPVSPASEGDFLFGVAPLKKKKRGETRFEGDSQYRLISTADTTDWFPRPADPSVLHLFHHLMQQCEAVSIQQRSSLGPVLWKISLNVSAFIYTSQETRSLASSIVPQFFSCNERWLL